jgi:signal transduction histidine kinase
MFRSRGRLRIRLALEFAAVAAVVNALLFLIVIGVREDRVWSAFDRELVLRARFAGQEAVRELKDGTVSLAAVDELQGGVRAGFKVHTLGGEVLGETSSMVSVSLDPIEAEAIPETPLLQTVRGDPFGKEGSSYRTVTLRVSGDDQPVVVHGAANMAPVHRALRNLRVLLLGVVWPIATLAAGLAGWMISDRVFRRIGQVARAAHDLKAGEKLALPQRHDEIGDMVGEMNGMIKRLEAAFDAQKKFILEVTHELKTPVSIMLAEAQLLARKSPASEPMRYTHFVANVEEETRRLGQLAESLLTVVRTGYGPEFVAETVVPINDIVCEAAERWEPLGRSAASRVSLNLHESRQEGDDLVLGDHDLLVTMVENLLGAVLDQAGPKRLLKVSVGRYNGTAEVGVEAVDPETNVVATPRLVNDRGHDLKMAIVRGIAQLHNGSVKAVGTRAVVKLPACISLPYPEDAAAGR